MKIDEDPLKEANGLRNVLVHRYNSTDDRMAFENIKRLTPKVSEFLEVVRKWVKEKAR